MSNGYLLAANADLTASRDIAAGFGLDILDASTLSDHDAAVTALSAAANVGVVLSGAAAADAGFVALMQTLGQRLQSMQLILASDDARAAFAFLPGAWPAMSLDEARARATELLRRRQQSESSVEEPARAHPLPPTDPEPAISEDAPASDEDAEAPAADDGELIGGAAPEFDQPEAETGDTPAEKPLDAREEEPAPAEEVEPPAQEPEPDTETFSARDDDAPPEPVDEASPPVSAEPPPAAREPEPEFGRSARYVPPPASAPAPAAPPKAPPPQAARKRAEPTEHARVGVGRAPSAPADATAFAPKKLRRGTPELVRIVIHQPKDLQAVIKPARKIDPRADPAPQGMPVGDIALGASIGVSIEARGAAYDGGLQRRIWAGEPIDFSFSAEADQGVKQAVFLARVFVDDAQIGVLAFTRNISGPSKQPASPGDRVRLKRHKRVFLSYSSKDRESVAQIATAYQAAGVEHFWDRASLKSGEEWGPRLRREIDRADLFHLCWSQAAASSEWVVKETEHALTRRRRNSGKPDITVQMLDGPPWAPHPPALDAINFDDFVRAAIVGYARGDGG